MLALAALLALGTVSAAGAVINEPPVAPHDILVFPVRDFVSGSGFGANDLVNVEVLRSGTVVGKALNVVPQDDPKTAGFDGMVDVNHPGGACWEGVTPDIRAGDVVRMSVGANSDQTTTANVVVTQPATQTGPGTVVVKGTAQGAAGGQIPLAQLEVRIVANKQIFDANGRRDIRAPGKQGFTFDYDAPGSTSWTATFSGLDAHDVNMALNGESRGIWLGRNPAATTEGTLYEFGQIPGPQAPCTAPLEGAVASIAPAALAFNAQIVGTASAAQRITVRNTGVAGNMTIASLTFGGPNPADFALGADTCLAAPIAPGGSCTIDVAFTPTAAGARSGSLLIGDNAAGGPHSVPLSGNGVAAGAAAAPIVSLAPSSLTFATRTPGTTSPAQQLTISNVGSAALTVTGFTFGGVNAGDFASTGDTCLGATIAVGASCTVGISFTPGAAGPRSGSIGIADNAADSPQTAALGGNGLNTVGINDPPAPGHQIISFPVRDFVSSSGYGANELVTVEVIRHGVVVGVAPDVVPQDDPRTPDVFDGIVEVNHPGGACWVGTTPDIRAGDIIRETPNDAAADQSTTSNVVVTQPATQTAPGTVIVKGTAQDANGNPISLGALSQRIIANRQIFDVNGRRLLRSGFAGRDGDLVYDAPGSIHWTATYTGLDQHDVDMAVAGESRMIWLGRDVAAGTELTIYEFGEIPGPTAPCTAPAAAPDPDASPMPTSLSFVGRTLGSTSAAQTVTMTNTGTAPLHVTTATITGVNLGDFAVSGNTCSGVAIAPGSSCTIGVTFTPSAAGARSATLRIDDDVVGAPQFVPLSGTGLVTAAPAAVLTPASLSFADRAVNTTSPLQSVTVTNAGQAPLHVSGVSLGGANFTDYAVASDGCSGTAVAPGATCTIGISFTPIALGTRNATLNVADDAVDSPQSIALTGSSSAIGAINQPPIAPHSVLDFPVRDFVSGAGYLPTDRVTVEVIRGGSVVGIARNVIPQDDPKTPDFDGLVDVNHPGGACWGDGALAGDPTVTPDIRAGDVVRYLTSTAPAAGDQTVVQNVVVTQPATNTAPGTIVVKGIAQDAVTGGPLPLDQVQTRLIANKDLFDINGRRDIRAGALGSEGTMVYDAPGSLHWTATFTGLDAADVARAVGSESRSIWLGTQPGAALEGTLYEFGQVPGPAAPCTAPLEGAAATAVAAPSSLLFSAAVGSTSAPQTVSLISTGTLNLNVAGVSIIGPNAADFAVSANGCAAASLAPTTSCGITVTFSPSAAGARSATLRIADNAADSPQLIPLNGNGGAAAPPPPPPPPPAGAPAVSTAPASLAFGDKVVGTASAAQAVSVTNTGTAPLHVTGLTFGAPNAADFAVSSDTCLGVAVAAGASCTVNVTFTPGALGARSSSLQIADDAAASPQSVALSGNGIPAPAPAASVAPASLAFANQVVNTTSASQAVTVTNSGNAPLTVSGLTIAGLDFAVSSNTCLAAPVAAGASCTVNVTFTPQAIGARSGSLSIADNAAGSPQAVALSGSGVAAPAPAVTLAPAAGLTFADRTVGTGASAAQLVTVTNSGTAALTFTGATLAGTNPGDFAISSNACVGSLAAGASCQIGVTFTPAAAGARSASLQVADNAAGSPQALALSGNGLAAPAAASFLLGNQAVEAKLDSNVAGLAEAFKTTAANSGSVTQLRIFVDTGSVGSVVAGLYANSATNHPGALLTSGSLASPVIGQFNTIAVPAASVTAGQTYWIAVLGPTGTLHFRDRAGVGAGSSETSAQANLAGMPATWSTGASFADGALSGFAAGTLTATPPPPPPPPAGAVTLLGETAVLAGVDSNAAGSAEAFKYTATASGTLAKLNVYVDTPSASTKVIAGLYSDAAGHPGTLLGSGTLAGATKGAFNAITTGAASVVAGNTYWIALLSPAGSGTLAFRDHCCGGAGPSETSSQTTLTALPATWSTGRTFLDGPASAFATNG